MHKNRMNELYEVDLEKSSNNSTYIKMLRSPFKGCRLEIMDYDMKEHGVEVTCIHKSGYKRIKKNRDLFISEMTLILDDIMKIAAEYATEVLNEKEKA